jgi:multiple sugar transport system permease protein
MRRSAGRVGGLERRSARLGRQMSAPAFAVIVLVTLVPIVLATVMSFATVSAGKGSLTFDWVGLTNYVNVLKSSNVQSSLIFTTSFALASVAVGLLFGTFIALILDEMSHGRAVILAFLLIPYSFITVVVGELWSYILNGVYGIANYILVSLHIISQPITFVNTTIGAFLSIVLADAWKTVPFITLIVLAGLRMIDRELYAAARVDGATWWTRVFKITLPLIRPAIITAMIFRVLQAFGVFDIIYVLTGGAPGNSTESVAMLIYNALFENFNVGDAAAISTLTTIVILAIAFSVIRVFRLQVTENDR